MSPQPVVGSRPSFGDLFTTAPVGHSGSNRVGDFVGTSQGGAQAMERQQAGQEALRLRQLEEEEQRFPFGNLEE